jgi:hypothetical protein
MSDKQMRIDLWIHSVAIIVLFIAVIVLFRKVYP